MLVAIAGLSSAPFYPSLLPPSPSIHSSALLTAFLTLSFAPSSLRLVLLALFCFDSNLSNHLLRRSLLDRLSSPVSASSLLIVYTEPCTSLYSRACCFNLTLLLIHTSLIEFAIKSTYKRSSEISLITFKLTNQLLPTLPR